MSNVVQEGVDLVANPSAVNTVSLLITDHFTLTYSNEATCPIYEYKIYENDASGTLLYTQSSAVFSQDYVSGKKVFFIEVSLENGPTITLTLNVITCGQETITRTSTINGMFHFAIAMAAPNNIVPFMESDIQANYTIDASGANTDPTCLLKKYVLFQTDGAAWTDPLLSVNADKLV